ncbi:MAG: GerMN domain-containing protein [Desulfobacterales bacterium]|nr:GerMN domain-containing protein [Desulfobacterales bacterium]
MKSGRTRILFVIPVIFLGVLLAFMLNRPDSASIVESVDLEGISPDGELEKFVAHLFFGGMDQEYLTAEEWALVYSGSPSELGYKILEALLSGPRGNHVRTIPEETVIRAFYITKQGTAFVDLTGGIRENHPGGIKAEIFTIFSIVNSLILNIEEINAVKILIDGNEVRTLAGHMDLTMPLRAEMRLIR